MTADHTVGTVGVPRRADGLVLIGEQAGSGYRVSPALVRRADGQTVQLTRLLYLVLRAVDGHRDLARIADEVSTAYGRAVSPEQVHRLLTDRLAPLGLLKLADGSEPQVGRRDPLLGLRFRYAVSDPEVTRRVTAPFAALFTPVLVALLVAVFAFVAWWVLFERGLGSATYDAFDRPGLLLLVFAVTVLSAGFHEFGHAAACRYGGATPGVMGTGLYLIWPAFYTDVTDSYRLGRAGRLRVDLGGLYFNAIVAVAVAAAWWVTGWEALLLVVATQILQMVRQLAPLARFDGYHVLADLVGVPDLYAHVRPTLAALLPWRWGRGERSPLRPRARAVIAAWVLLVVPLMVACLLLVVLALPRILATAWAGAGEQWRLLVDAWSRADLLQAAAHLLGIVAIALPMIGIGYVLARLGRQSLQGLVRWTGGRPGRRVVAGALVAALLTGVAWAWWPSEGTYRPVRPYERGTVLDAVPVARSVPTGLEEGRTVEVSTVWPQDAPPPSPDRPALALVLVPRSVPEAGGQDGGPDGGATTTAPVWVFPFNAPAPPGEGDNQALAVNTTDGSVLYDVAFALVWATDGSATNANEAYAIASCTGCQTVAVAFQVVLVLGQADVVVPENYAVAVNYGCAQCVTAAIATQLVLTVPEGLSEEGSAALAALWEEIAAFAELVPTLPLDEVRARIVEYEASLLAIVEAEAGRAAGGGAPSVGPGDDPTGATPTPTGTTSADGDGPTAPTTAPQTTSSPTATSSPTTSSTPSSSTPTSSTPTSSSPSPTTSTPPTTTGGTP
ncbi:MAG: hypothetical protein ACLGIV_12735 [Actinomycetes bacterium]